MMRRDVFQAIADPVRRDIIGLLANSPQTVSAVAEAFPISRPAVSKHLKILQECGIVEYRKQGRERYCHLHPQSLQPVAEWMAHHRQLWEAKLDAFEQYLEDLQSPNKQ
ncbi:MAG: metalloregulator ArsR/SmtB family transcription factor [Bacteroidota bacterium]